MDWASHLNQSETRGRWSALLSRGGFALMLKILGVVMLVFWLIESASHRPLASWVHLLSIVACISFVAEFVRSRAVAAWESREGEFSEAAPTVNEVPSSPTSASRTSVSVS